MKHLLVALTLCLAVGVPLSAHHYFASKFDGNKVVTLTGVVTKLNWTNPHSFVYLDVRGRDGRVVNWACEASPPGVLARFGLLSGDIKIGDTVTIDGYGAKDGSQKLATLHMTLRDGRKVASALAGP